MMPALNQYLVLAALMFVIGVVGFVVRRNTLVMFMCLELMLNAVAITFAAFSHFLGNLDGQVAVFFIIVVAAAEAAVGLALIIALFRAAKSVSTADVSELRG